MPDPIYKLRIVDQNGNDLTLGATNIVDFGAVSYKEIVQNIRTILITPQFTVPLNRLFGMEFLFLDKPMNQARDILVAEILEKIAFWEKRVIGIGIDIEDDAQAALTGKMTITTHVRIANVTYAGIPYSNYMPGGFMYGRS